MTECVVPQEKTISSSYEFHVKPEESPVFDVESKGEFLIYKEVV